MERSWCHRGAGEMQVWFPTEATDETAVPDLALSASHCFSGDSVGAMCDGILPQSSGDTSVRRFTFWDHLGTDEWVACEFGEPEELNGVEVYWFDDGKKGRCRVPESWKVQWREAKGAPWQDVERPAPVAKDTFCTVDFPASVKAQAVRLCIRLQGDFSGGILEWRFK